MPVKAIVHEKFGDGIMSAIDFTIEVERVEDPKGDRIQLIMCGSCRTRSGKMAPLERQLSNSNGSLTGQ